MSDNAAPTQPNTQPSMIHGHVAYVTGAVEETLGSLTGYENLQRTGHDTKTSALAELRAADAATADSRAHSVAERASAHPGVVGAEGQAERVVGGAVFCEGLQRHGEEKQSAAKAVKGA
ncbi:hypothetical protein HK104_000601 [Borealophlyctis nickersoniae]|nr:hypothetical protein HK104_000601 [Borealophlyctis nickersoniae]